MVPATAKAVSLIFVVAMIVLLFEHAPVSRTEAASPATSPQQSVAVAPAEGRWSPPPAADAVRDDPPVQAF